MAKPLKVPRHFRIDADLNDKLVKAGHSFRCGHLKGETGIIEVALTAYLKTPHYASKASQARAAAIRTEKVLALAAKELKKAMSLLILETSQNSIAAGTTIQTNPSRVLRGN